MKALEREHDTSFYDWRGFNYLSIVGIVILLITAAAEVWDYRYRVAGTLTMFTAATVISLWWLWRRAPLLAFILVVGTILNAWGWVWEWYHKIGWYDEVTHVLTPLAVTALAAWYLLEPWMGATVANHRWRVSLLIIFVGAGIGALWEIGEWFAFLTTKNPQVIKSLQDTITDMICGVFGSVLSIPFFFQINRRYRGQNAAHPEQVHDEKGAWRPRPVSRDT